MARINIVYNGCDDPVGFLEKAHRERELLAGGHDSGFRDLEGYFNDVEFGGALGLYPTEGVKRYGSYENLKKVMLAERDRREMLSRTASRLARMSIRDLLSSMSDIKKGIPVGPEAAEEIRRDVVARYGTSLADDYVEYVALCGSMVVSGIEHTGARPDDEHDIRLAIGDVRGQLDIVRKYYPLCSVESDKTVAVMYFQDGSGIVYVLTEDLVLEPCYGSLSQYFASTWWQGVEGLL